MATFTELEERIAELERKLKAGNLPLDALPMKSLTQRLSQIQTPEGDDFMLPHSAGPDSLAAVPAAKIARTTAFAVPAGVHTCVPMTAVRWQQGVQIDLVNFPTRITIVRPGIYHITSHTFLTGSYVSCGINISGRLVARSEGWGGAGAVLLGATTVEPIRAGEYVEMTNYTNTGGVSTGVEECANFGGCVTCAQGSPHLAVTYLSHVEGL